MVLSSCDNFDQYSENYASMFCDILMKFMFNAPQFTGILYFCRNTIARHYPYCVDLHEDTFEMLCIFLERYCNNFSSEIPPAPFATKEYVLREWFC